MPSETGQLLIPQLVFEQTGVPEKGN